MKLVNGRTYMDRTGRRVIVRETTGDKSFPFMGDNLMFYTSDGRYLDALDLSVSAFDLIQEVTPIATGKTQEIINCLRDYGTCLSSNLVEEVIDELERLACIKKAAVWYVENDDSPKSALTHIRRAVNHYHNRK